MVKRFNVAKYMAEEQEVPPGDTTVENVANAMSDLYHARKNLPEASHSCGKSQEAMKFAFWEYLRRKPPIYTGENNYEKPTDRKSIAIPIE